MHMYQARAKRKTIAEYIYNIDISTYCRLNAEIMYVDCSISYHQYPYKLFILFMYIYICNVIYPALSLFFDRFLQHPVFFRGDGH